MSLYDDTVKLAHDNPGPLRDALLPVLKKHAAGREPYTRPNAKYVDWNDVTKSRDNTTEAMAKHLVFAEAPRKMGKGFLLFPEALTELPESALDSIAKGVLDGWKRIPALLSYQVEKLPEVRALRGEDWDELGPGPEGDEQYGYRDQDPKYQKIRSALSRVRYTTEKVTSPRTGKQGLQIVIKPSVGQVLRKFGVRV